MLGRALEFLFDRVGGKILAGLALIGGLVAAFAFNNASQRAAGAATERANIERAAHENVRRAHDVRERSSAGGAGRVLDPYAEDR